MVVALIGAASAIGVALITALGQWLVRPRATPPDTLLPGPLVEALADALARAEALSQELELVKGHCAAYHGQRRPADADPGPGVPSA